ncbi:MAG: hypothetical protein WDA07_01510 [Leucobacter sp.]
MSRAFSARRRRLDGRGDAGYAAMSVAAQQWPTQTLVNTSAPAGFTPAGGSALWPPTLVGPPSASGVSPGRPGVGGLSPRRRISARGAATLHHRIHPGGDRS